MGQNWWEDGREATIVYRKRDGVIYHWSTAGDPTRIELVLSEADGVLLAHQCDQFTRRELEMLEHGWAVGIGIDQDGNPTKGKHQRR